MKRCFNRPLPSFLYLNESGPGLRNWHRCLQRPERYEENYQHLHEEMEVRREWRTGKCIPKVPPIATDYIICPFTTVIDTREQSPFSFRGIKSDAKQGGKPLIIKTTTKTSLTSGDYSIGEWDGALDFS